MLEPWGSGQVALNRSARVRDRESIRIRMWRGIMAMLFTASFAASAGAQQSQAPDLRSALITAVNAGWNVQAVFADSTYYRGKISSVTDSTFFVGRFGPISNASVNALYRVHRNDTGMLIVGGLGAAIGLIFLGFSSADSPCQSCGAGVYALAGLGAIVGAFASGDNLEVLWRN